MLMSEFDLAGQGWRSNSSRMSGDSDVWQSTSRSRSSIRSWNLSGFMDQRPGEPLSPPWRKSSLHQHLPQKNLLDSLIRQNQQWRTLAAYETTVCRWRNLAKTPEMAGSNCPQGYIPHHKAGPHLRPSREKEERSPQKHMAVWLGSRHEKGRHHLETTGVICPEPEWLGSACWWPLSQTGL